MSNNFPKGYSLPPWVVLVVVSRDIIIIIGSVIIYLMKGVLEIMPSKLGKTTTFFQMLTVISVLLHFKYAFVIWNLAAIFTVLSGMGYIRRGSVVLSENSKH